MDACWNTRILVGTNGQIVAFVCTNSATAPGFTHADYGLKHMKPMIRLLRRTIADAGYYSPVAYKKHKSISASEDPDEPVRGDCSDIWDYVRPYWDDLADMPYSIESFTFAYTAGPEHGVSFYARSCCNMVDPLFWYSMSAEVVRHERPTLFRAVGGMHKMARSYAPGIHVVEFGSLTKIPGFGACDDTIFVPANGPTAISYSAGVYYDATDYSPGPFDPLQASATLALVALVPELGTADLCDPPLEDRDWRPPYSDPHGDCEIMWGASGQQFRPAVFVLDWHSAWGFGYP